MSVIRRITAGFGRAVGAIFDSRDIVIRRRGKVVYFTLSKWVQLPLLAVALAAIGWVSYVNIMYFGFEKFIDSKNYEIAGLMQQNQSLSGQVVDMEGNISDVAGTLKNNTNNLVGLLTLNDRYKAEIESLKQNLQESTGKRGKQLRRQAALSTRLNNLETELNKAEKSGSRLSKKLDNAKSELTTALVDRGAFASARDWLQKRVDRLEQRIVFLRRSQKQALTQVSERTALDIKRIEQIVAKVGLNSTDLLKKLKPSVYAMGGPFIPAGKESAVLEDEDVLLERHLSHWSDLRDLLTRLPLVAPLNYYRITSKFGRRRDPVNGKMARHKGLDIAAPLRSPVFAPASGKVIFSGWKGRFGRMIVIDHGFGIKTRYGHLRRLYVKRGKQVKFGDKIAQLGSSGRSTGPHVHYEILVNGKSVNPLDFIKAGKDVFKG
jgi:murein DD-endopeptidase MepM/ murein hydrolase activator NlpD